MKIVICWTQFSGYMAACWRELSSVSGIDLHVFCFRDTAPSRFTSFDSNLLQGIDHTFLNEEERRNPAIVRQLVVDQRPDAVVLAGWSNAAYRRLAFSTELTKARFILAMDTPYRGDVRQRLARWSLNRFLSRMDWVFVAGEQTRTYARHLGVTESRIQKGVYAYDQTLFNEAVLGAREQSPDGWPRRFVYVGRYVAEKAVDVLIDAYKLYRERSNRPWSLDCFGMGPFDRFLKDAPGVVDHGFVQPAKQPEMFLRGGALVLPSRYEPWGVVIAEAMATGLPVVCTTTCGAATSLLHNYFNGIEVAPGDAESLARALYWIEQHHDELPSMGRRAAAVAQAYSSEAWARRMYSMCANQPT